MRAESLYRGFNVSLGQFLLPFPVENPDGRRFGFVFLLFLIGFFLKILKILQLLLVLLLIQTAAALLVILFLLSLFFRNL